jgi:hypothetical protein
MQHRDDLPLAERTGVYAQKPRCSRSAAPISRAALSSQTAPASFHHRRACACPTTRSVRPLTSSYAGAPLQRTGDRHHRDDDGDDAEGEGHRDDATIPAINLTRPIESGAAPAVRTLRATV